MHFSIKQVVISIAVVVFLLFSCNEGTKETTNESASAFFPVTDFIKSQLKEIDSLQLPVSLYRSGTEGTDTSLLSTDSCSMLATPFFTPDLNDPAVSSHFTESSFADQSIPNVTFNYMSKDSSMPLKRVDVVVQPMPSGLDKVTTIYMEKVYLLADTLVEEKMFWKTDHYYYIIRSKATPTGTTTLSQQKIVWDPTE